MTETTSYDYQSLRPSLEALQDFLEIPGNIERLEAQIKARVTDVIAEYGNIGDENFEIPQQLRGVRLWDVMLDEKIIRPNQRDNLNNDVPTIGDVVDKKFDLGSILRSPNLGRKTADQIVSFVISNYGFSLSPSPVRSYDVETVGEVPDVVKEFEADLDTFIGETIDFEAIGISKTGKERLITAGVSTVGDFFLITNDRLKNEFQVPSNQINKLRDFIIGQYGIPKYLFQNPGVIPSLVRARTTAAKVKETS